MIRKTEPYHIRIQKRPWGLSNTSRFVDTKNNTSKISLSHVRYIKILPRLWGFRVKIANISRLHCLPIPIRDLGPVYKERGLPFCRGYPCKRVKVSSGLQATSSPGRFSLALEVLRPPMPGKSALAGDEVGLQANFTGRVTLSPGSTLQALLTCYVMRAFFVTVQNLK